MGCVAVPKQDIFHGSTFLDMRHEGINDILFLWPVHVISYCRWPVRLFAIVVDVFVLLVLVSCLGHVVILPVAFNNSRLFDLLYSLHALRVLF